MEGKLIRTLGVAAAVTFLSLTAGCAGAPTLLDAQEEALGIKDNALGANHRAFHSVLHYPHGIGLRIPGYIVGIEKSRQGNINGPEDNRHLVHDPKTSKQLSKIYDRIVSQPKAHLITHVMKYSSNANGAVFPGRIKPCALYSILSPDGGNGEQGAAAKGADGLFTMCDGAEHRFGDNAFENSWKGISALRENLKKDLQSNSYSHILVIAMGWNTPQDNSVQNYNSLLSQVLDEVEAQRRDGQCKGRDDTRDICTFKPLVVGVSWASDWELSDLLPIPDALIKLVSFPNKANDAKEVGVTWLNAVLYNAVLPARRAAANETDKKIKVVVIGHSFGGRAMLAGVSSKSILVAPTMPEFKSAPFNKDDIYISLQSAFKVEELFQDENVKKSLIKAFDNDGLKVVLTTSQYDSANEIAFWGTYVGMIKAHQKLCGDNSVKDIKCAYIPKKKKGVETGLNYGYALCDGLAENRDVLTGQLGDPLDKDLINAWKKAGPPVLYVDASTLINCRAAFTGGGSHSDIYRLETARFIWDMIR